MSRFATQHLRSLCLLAALGAAGAALADGEPPAISVACQACHGGDGISLDPTVPNLAGQKLQYLKNQLRAFKAGERKHDIMNPIARQLAASDIDSLASFWSSLPAAGAPREPAAAALQARRSRMSFPVGFPAGFTAYATDEDQDAKLVTTTYANEVALRAAREGKPLPAGSIILVTNAPALLDAAQHPRKDAQGHLMPGPIKSYSAMEAQAGWGKDLPGLLANGDWQYALFNDKRERSDKPNYALCFGCHKGVAADSYVFTAKKLKEKAGRA